MFNLQTNVYYEEVRTGDFLLFKEIAGAANIEKDELNECENIKEEVCSLCLRIPGCSWCTLKVYPKLFNIWQYFTFGDSRS